MIELKNVTKTYASKQGPITALQDINLHVAAGEIFGVIGRSGAGKSTLIRCVNLLERPTQGQVLVAGQDLMTLSAAALREARHNIGMVFQHFNLLSTRSAFQNIALPLELLGKSKSEVEKTVTPLLELTGLRERRDAYPNQLSGGQKQRVAIARALATRPQVLLCDEMTSSLDPETTGSILQLIKKINAEMDLTILLITHEMDVIKVIADKVAVLDESRIVEANDVLSIFKNPQTEVARSFARASLQPELPLRLERALCRNPQPDGFTIVKILFSGDITGEPIINDLVRTQPVSVDILHANMEYLRQETLGMMVLSLYGPEQGIAAAQQFLQQRGLQIEVIGYVAADEWAIN